MKNLTVENNKIYREPTDDDAKDRPMVEVRGCENACWALRELIAVTAANRRFVALSRDRLFAVSWKYARIDTGIVIPDGWRPVDTKNEPWRWGSKVWYDSAWHTAGAKRKWGDQSDSTGQWFDNNYIYIVPIDPPAPPEPTAEDYLAGHNASGLKVGDRVRVTRAAADREQGWCNNWPSGMSGMSDMLGKVYEIAEDSGKYGFKLQCYKFPYFVLEKVEPQYRPFETWQEWWPHRDRLVVDKDNDIFRQGWFGADDARDHFESGYRFCNEDGTPGEPYGVMAE